MLRDQLDLEKQIDDTNMQRKQFIEVPPGGEELYEISLVVPVYNQAKNITQTLDRIRKIMIQTQLPYEIIVVNDGSTDNTLELLQRQKETDCRVKLFSYDKNKGKGYAVRTGIMNSKGEAIVFIDGDSDVSVESIVEFIAAFRSCDLIIASKAHPLSRVNAPLSRRILSKGFNYLVRLMLGLEFRDTQSGLKAGNGDVLRVLFKFMTVRRYAFDVELLAMAHAMKLRVKEMPIEINLDGRFNIAEILVMLKDLLAISYRYRKMKAKSEELNLTIKYLLSEKRHNQQFYPN